VAYAESARRRRNRLRAALSGQSTAANLHTVRAVLEEHLRIGARLLDARMVLLWENADEPSLEVAEWKAGGLRTWREAPDTFRPFVADSVNAVPFGMHDARRPGAPVLATRVHGAEPSDRAAVNDAVVQRFGCVALVSAPFAGADVVGRLFGLMERTPTADDVAIAHATAVRLGEALARVVATGRLLDVGAMEERDRLARELHDGVLQSLAGAALHLKRAERFVEARTPEVAAVLASAQQMLAEEQRDLRFYVQDLRPLADDAGDPWPAFETRLRQLAARVNDVWGLGVQVGIQPLRGVLSQRAMHEVYRIAQEALANVARHSHATDATLTVEHEEGIVRMIVSDNGRGFPFRGEFQDAELTAQRLGPVTLKARIHALGGSVNIASSDGGARLYIAIPLGTGAL